jgi:MYXO-CTERM domain-containing protein
MTSAQRVCALAAGLFAGTAVRPQQAAACGGFFCSTVPIDQSGENILFSIDSSGVRAYIQIQYQGKADSFAWVVPVTAAPKKIGVGVQQMFTTLLGATQPQFRIDWKSTCGVYAIADAGVARVDSAAASDAGAGVVAVIDQGEVGPYDYVVVAATDADKLRTWLNDNGFVQPPSAQPALTHYVQQGFAFVAIKLRREAQVGDIQPLVIDLPGPEACVPLVLTRIAAIPDMPVTVLMLGNGRAAPKNWFEVEPNPRRIDWFRSGSNYRQVVTAAVDEAGGRAFVTEFAGPTTRFKQNLWAPGRYDLTRLAGIKDPATFVQVMLQIGLPRDPIIQTLLRKYIPMPASVRARGVSEAQFYNSLSFYAKDLAGQPFDGAAFAKEIDERIVTPLREAQEMLDRQPTLTRLFTTVSPDEMTRDPLFEFNRDLPSVSNLHVATGTGTCGTDGRISNATLTFDNGDKLSFSETFYTYVGPPNTSYMQGQPAASRISLVGPAGAPIPIAASAARMYDKQLDTMDPEIVRQLARQGVTPEPAPDAGAPGPRRDAGPPFEPPFEPLPRSPVARHGGCSVGAGASSPWPLAALGLALLTSRRRSTRRRRGAGGSCGGGHTTA